MNLWPVYILLHTTKKQSGSYCSTELITWSRVLLEQPIVAQLVKIPAFLGPEGSLPVHKSPP